MNNGGYNACLCPVSKTLELIGGKWKPIILYLVQHGVNRFGALQRCMPNVSRKVLAAQLRDLESHGLLHRDVRVIRPPQEVIYSLTEKGLSLRSLIDEIMDWGTENLLDEESRRAIMIIKKGGIPAWRTNTL